MTAGNFLMSGAEPGLSLKNLYERHGYGKFKMDKFEEYDLYLQNKSFLKSGDIITFHSPDGKLLALKPDITLSIVKGIRDEDGADAKVYYFENVYRSPRPGEKIKEITHIGLEYIGDIDLYAMCEVITLASESLKIISGDFVLCLSHMGLISGVLDNTVDDYDCRKRLFRCIGEKNAHEIVSICEKAGIPEKDAKKIEAFAKIYGDFEPALARLKAVFGREISQNAIKELESLYNILKLSGNGENLRLDLSIMNDMNYYNGVIFQGFIDGVPEHILSGGRYDGLVKRLGKRGGAVGFAIYPDFLEHYNRDERETGVDILLIYDNEMDIPAVVKAVKRLAGDNQRVRVIRKDANAGDIRYKRILHIKDMGGVRAENKD